MIVKYETDLSRQSFYEFAGTLIRLGTPKLFASFTSNNFFLLGEIENPVLALDSEKLASLDNGKLIFALFNEEGLPLTTEYDGVYNTWHKLNGTWPCSIDTMVHLNGQRKSAYLQQAEKVLDLCCGTGIAGIYAMKKGNLKKLDFSDINPHCVGSALINYYKSVGNKKLKLPSFFVSDGLSSVPERYDVILASAPPAIPSYPSLERPLNPLFEGTGLLEDILRDAPNHLNNGGRLIISHSSLGDKAFGEAAKKYGAKIEKILSERENVFRTEFLDSEEWIDYLVKEHGMIEREGDYPYWHTVQTKEVSY